MILTERRTSFQPTAWDCEGLVFFSFGGLSSLGDDQATIFFCVAAGLYNLLIKPISELTTFNAWFWQ